MTRNSLCQYVADSRERGFSRIFGESREGVRLPSVVSWQLRRWIPIMAHAAEEIRLGMRARTSARDILSLASAPSQLSVWTHLPFVLLSDLLVLPHGILALLFD